MIDYVNVNQAIDKQATQDKKDKTKTVKPGQNQPKLLGDVSWRVDAYDVVSPAKLGHFSGQCGSGMTKWGLFLEGKKGRDESLELLTTTE